MVEIKGESFDGERALYASRSMFIENCEFSGKADGTSALKESRDITVRGCRFDTRYPLWHNLGLKVDRCRFTVACEDPIWYTKHAEIRESSICGPRAFRECKDVVITDCEVESREFGWHCRDIDIRGGHIGGGYLFLGSSGLILDGIDSEGDDPFQYCMNLEIRNCNIRSGCAFWHVKKVTISDSVIEGGCPGWYSTSLHLIRCRIVGTRPFCYARDLVMEDCTMEGCDMSFEYSSVDVSVEGRIDSILNPADGKIVADEIGEVITDDNRRVETECRVVIRSEDVWD